MSDKTVFANSTVEFRISGFDNVRLVDARQSSGRFEPVFPTLVSGSAREEEYVARMVARDRQLNLG